MKLKTSAAAVLLALSAGQALASPTSTQLTTGFSDLSIADAASRLPGVSSPRGIAYLGAANPNAQPLSIRGLSGDFVGAALNGRALPGSSFGSGLDLDLIPVELIDSLGIEKSATDAIGGVINLRTTRPLDLKGPRLYVDYADTKGGLGTSQRSNGERFSVSGAQQFFGGAVGVSMGFSRALETGPTNDRFEVWGVANGVPDVNGQLGSAPGGLAAWQDTSRSQRDAATATFEFRPNAAFRSTLDGFYSSKETKDLTRGFQAPIGYSSSGAFDPIADAVLAGSLVNGVWQSGTFDNFKGNIRNDSNFRKSTLSSVGLKNELKLGNVNFALDVSRSQNRRHAELIETQAGLAGSALPFLPGETISWTGFDGTERGVQNARYTTSRNYADRGQVGLTDVFGVGGGASLPQAAYGKLSGAKDTIDNASLAAAIDLPNSTLFSGATVGFDASKRVGERTHREGRGVLPGGDPFASLRVPGNEVVRLPALGGFGVVAWDPTGSFGPIFDLQDKLVPDINNATWKHTLNERSVFGKLDLRTTAFGTPISGDVGLRYVRSKQLSSGSVMDGQACPMDVCPTSAIQGGKTYSDILPSANIRLDLGDDLSAFVQANRSMSRVNMGDLRASTDFLVYPFPAEGGEPRFEGRSGNPALEPVRANNVSLGLAKEIEGAKFGGAVFRKDIRNLVQTKTVAFDFAPLVTSNTPLPASGSTMGLLTRPVNGGSASSWGHEVYGVLPVGVLTQDLRDFTLFANYANTRAKARIPGLVDMSANLGLTYAKNGFRFSLARSFRSESNVEFVGLYGVRRTEAVVGQSATDLQVAYDVRSGFAQGARVMFTVQNLGKDKSEFRNQSAFGNGQRWDLRVSYAL